MELQKREAVLTELELDFGNVSFDYGETDFDFLASIPALRHTMILMVGKRGDQLVNAILFDEETAADERSRDWMLNDPWPDDVWHVDFTPEESATLLTKLEDLV